MTRGDFSICRREGPLASYSRTNLNSWMASMKHVARAGLAVALLVGFYVLAVGLAVVLVVALVQVLRLGFAGLPIALLFALVVPVVFAVLYGVFGRSRDGEPPGVLLTEQAQPRLWAVARELADLAETHCADEIRLVPDANAAVSDSGSWLGLRAGTRRLYLGVPLAARARRGPAAVRARPRVRPLRRPAHGTGRRHLPRHRDDPAHHQPPRSATPRIAAVPALCAPLLRGVAQREPPPGARGRPAQRPLRRAGGGRVRSAGMAPLAVAWEHYLHGFAAMGREIGRRPTGLLAGFADHLASPEVIRARRSCARHPTRRRRRSSTPTRAPARASRRCSAEPLLPRGSQEPRRSACSTTPERAFADLEDSLYDESGLAPTPLAELAPLAGADLLARRSGAFDKVMLEQGRPPGISTVYQSLGNGTAARLLRQLVPEEQRDLPKVTARVLADYLGAALLAIDQARVELDWASGWALVDPAGMPLELTALVEEVLADPLLAPELHELMRLSGVSDSWRRAGGHRPQDPDRPRPRPGRALPRERRQDAGRHRQRAALADAELGRQVLDRVADERAGGEPALRALLRHDARRPGPHQARPDDPVVGGGRAARRAEVKEPGLAGRCRGRWRAADRQGAEELAGGRPPVGGAGPSPRRPVRGRGRGCRPGSESQSASWGNQIAISRSADSGESEPCTRFSRLDSERSPRIVPGAALRPSVAPLSARTTSTASSPSRTSETQRTAGHEVAQRRVEVLRDVLGVVLVGQRVVDGAVLHRDDRQPLGLEAGQDLAHQPTADGVGLEQDQRA